MALMVHDMAWLGCGMCRINAIGQSGKLFQYARPYYCWRRAQAMKPFEQLGHEQRRTAKPFVSNRRYA